MPKSLNILGISGSLREKSFNTALLRATKALMPDHINMDIYRLNDIPMYNPEIHPEPTETVQPFLDAISQADGLIIATPEYNHSVTGALKNAIDWASRKFDKDVPVVKGKPVGLMCAVTGGYGGVRGYQHLRDITFAVNMHTLNRPMILVPNSRSKFDDDLKLTDETTLGFIKDFIENFESWVHTINGS